jgi:hypothetical protein
LAADQHPAARTLPSDPLRPAIRAS